MIIFISPTISLSVLNGHFSGEPAFDSVDRLALWKALRGIGIPQYLLQLIEDLHNGSTSSVRIGATLSPSFITTSGVRQGCVLAPALFCRAVDWIMERVASRTGFSLGNDHFTDLDYADDVCVTLMSAFIIIIIIKSLLLLLQAHSWF